MFICFCARQNRRNGHRLQRWALEVEQDSYDVFPVFHDFLEIDKVKIDKTTETTIRLFLQFRLFEFIL